MVSFLELSGFDDRLVVKLAEALSLQAEILESEGSLVLAGVRREQAQAVLESIDPGRAN
jgi:hydrogenase maturation factor